MIDRLTTYLMHIPALVGAEIDLGPDGTLSIHAALLEQKRGEIQLVRSEYELTGIAALCAFVPAGVPVVLCVVGRAVLHKITAGVPAGQPPIPQPSVAAPNAAELIHQVIEIEGGQLTSRMRGHLLADLLAALQAEKITPLAVSLGPFAALPFVGELAGEASTVQFGRHELQLNGDRLTGYRWLDQEPQQPIPHLEFAGMAMNRRIFPAFITAFATLLGMEIPGPVLPAFSGSVTEYRYRLSFWRSAKAIAAAVLLVLLVNIGVYLSYSDSAAGGAAGIPPVRQQELDSLRTQLRIRDTLLAGLGVQQGAHLPGMAYLADQLAASLPTSIVLTSLVFNPMDAERSRRLRKPVVTPLSVDVTGSCNALPQVMQWIEHLRTFGFCKNAELAHYRFNDRTATGDFKLTLTLRD